MRIDMKSRVMPATLFGYIWQISSRHQAGLCLLSVAVFLLSAVPLELQRRIVNDAIGKGALDTIVWLAIAYAVVALAEGVVKLWLNIYRSLVVFVPLIQQEINRRASERIHTLRAVSGGIAGATGGRQGQRSLGRRGELVSREDRRRDALPAGGGRDARDREWRGSGLICATPG